MTTPTPQPSADPTTGTTPSADAIRLALHRAVMPYAMSLAPALGGTQEAYDDFLNHLTGAVVALHPQPVGDPGTRPSTAPDAPSAQVTHT